MIINNVPGLPKGILRNIDNTTDILSDFNTLTKEGIYEIKMDSTTLHTPMTLSGSLVYTGTIEVHTYQSEGRNVIGHTIKFIGATYIYTYNRVGIIVADDVSWSGWTKEIIDIPVFTPATDDTDGVTGLVPAPTVEDKDKFLKSDGTWEFVPTTGEDIIDRLGYKPAKITVSDSYTLTANGWSDNTQTVNVEHIVSNISSIDVIGQYMAEWAIAGVYADSETDTSITFKCNEVPATDLAFKIITSTVS